MVVVVVVVVMVVVVVVMVMVVVVVVVVSHICSLLVSIVHAGAAFVFCICIYGFSTGLSLNRGSLL